MHILNVTTGADLPDVLPSARYSGVSLSPDNGGLYYAKFTHQGTNVWFHKFGTPVADDPKIFGGEYRGKQLGELDLVGVHVTDNHHFLIVSIAHGVPATSEDYPRQGPPQARQRLSSRSSTTSKPTSASSTHGDRFFLMTDYQAPNTRIVEATPGSRSILLEDHRPGRQRSHRQLQHRRRQALRLTPARRQNRDHHLHPRWQGNRHAHLSRHRHRLGRLRPSRPRPRASTPSTPSSSRPPSIATTQRPATPKSSPRPKSPSTPRSTKSPRSSTPQRTAPASPCSSPAKKACPATAPRACS